VLPSASLPHEALRLKSRCSVSMAQDSKDAVFQGYLFKRGDYLHDWRQRYFILYRAPPRLAYFTNYEKDRKPKKTFDLRFAFLKDIPRDINTEKRSGFALIAENNTYYLTADKEADVLSWRNALLSVIPSDPASPKPNTTSGAASSSSFFPSLIKITQPAASPGVGAGKSVVQKRASVAQTQSPPVLDPHSLQDNGRRSRASSNADIKTPFSGPRLGELQSTPTESPLPSRLLQKQDLSVGGMYASTAEFLQAVKDGFVIVTFDNTHDKGLTTVELTLNADNISWRANTSVLFKNVPVWLDGVACQFAGEISLATLRGTGLLAGALAKAA